MSAVLLVVSVSQLHCSLPLVGLVHTHVTQGALPCTDGTNGFNVLCAGGASRFKEGDEASSSEDYILLQLVRCECSRTHTKTLNK